MPIKTLLAFFSEELNAFADNDQDWTRAKTPAQFNNVTAKNDLIRKQAPNLSTAFGFINSINQNSKIYRF